MDVNIDKMTCNLSCIEELSPLKYFKQFNVYQSVLLYNRNSNIYSVETTVPCIEVYSTKMIDTKIIETIKGTSLEGQHLSGKKLIIVGNINMSLIVSYYKKKKITNKNNVVKIKIPFSTFIIMPKEMYDIQRINLRYLIEDATVIKLSYNKVFVSVTVLIQYIDEY